MSDVITIDGPGSSGKTVVGELFAHKIGYQFIDTGMIYRVYAAYVLNNNIPLDDDEEVTQVLKNIKIEFKNIGQKYQVLADGVDITDKLRHPSITETVPQVAAKKVVRDIAYNIQRHLGIIANTVMSGRDIGTEIFPEAKLKFYITASPQVRAKRRTQQLREDGHQVTEDEILKQITDRDRQDEQRSVSPLRIPPGAIVVDTSDLTLEQSVDKLAEYYVQQNHA